MLHLLDDAVASFLRAELGPSARGVDVVFAAPDRDWSGGLTRPTINCYLWSVTPAAQGNVAGFETVIDGDRAYRRPAQPRIDLRYLLTAWADHPEDEHQVLGALVTLLARPRQLPTEHLPGALAAVEPPPLLQLAGPAPDERADFWSALGGRYRPGLDLCVTTPVEVDELVPLKLAPKEIRVAVADRYAPARRSVRDWFRRAS